MGRDTAPELESHAKKIASSVQSIEPSDGTRWRHTRIYAANGVDQKINILLRSSLEVLTSFGDGGRGPGQFFGVHNLANDSKGNLYATETYTGARVQRFVYKGVVPVTKAEQGVVRPRAR